MNTNQNSPPNRGNLRFVLVGDFHGEVVAGGVAAGGGFDCYLVGVVAVGIGGVFIVGDFLETELSSVGDLQVVSVGAGQHGGGGGSFRIGDHVRSYEGAVVFGVIINGPSVTY